MVWFVMNDAARILFLLPFKSLILQDCEKCRGTSRKLAFFRDKDNSDSESTLQKVSGKMSWNWRRWQNFSRSLRVCSTNQRAFIARQTCTRSSFVLHPGHFSVYPPREKRFLIVTSNKKGSYNGHDNHEEEYSKDKGLSLYTREIFLFPYWLDNSEWSLPSPTTDSVKGMYACSRDLNGAKRCIFQYIELHQTICDMSYYRTHKLIFIELRKNCVSLATSIQCTWWKFMVWILAIS